MCTQVQAGVGHVRWLNYYTIQVEYTPKPDMYTICYTRRNPIYLVEGLHIGCLKTPTDGTTVYFELGRNLDINYNPREGDQYQVTVYYRDGITEVSGWYSIENTRPPKVTLALPLILALQSGLFWL